VHHRSRWRPEKRKAGTPSGAVRSERAEVTSVGTDDLPLAGRAVRHGIEPAAPHGANPLALQSWSDRRELPRLAVPMDGRYVYILVLMVVN
jgi:hypothetical protein